MADRQLCTFRLGGLLIGIDVHRVQEVLTGPDVTPVPLAPPAVRGLINLRGQVLTVIDARTRLGLAGSADTDGVHVVLIGGGHTVSLVVDDDDEVVEIDDASLQEVPTTVSEAIRACASGAHQLDGDLMIVLDVDLTLALHP